MHRKIKAVLRGARRNKSPSSRSPRQSYESSAASSPRAERFSTDHRGRASLEASSPRSRPVSSAKDGLLNNGTSSHPAQNTQTRSSAPASDFGNGSIADDYKSYLPALAPVHDAHHKENLAQSNRESNGHYVESNVNTQRSSLDPERNKPLPQAPSKFLVDLPGLLLATKLTYSAGLIETAQGRLRKQSIGARSSHETSDGRVPDWKVQQAALREGVVDLRNTVDVDKDTRLAARTYLPAVIACNGVDWTKSDPFQPLYMRSSNPTNTKSFNTKSTVRSTTIHTIIVCSLSCTPKYSHHATSFQTQMARASSKSPRTNCHHAQARTDGGR